MDDPQPSFLANIEKLMASKGEEGSTTTQSNLKDISYGEMGTKRDYCCLSTIKI